MSQNTITLQLTPQQQDKLYQAFQESAVTPPQYAKWQLRPENCVITCYTSNKTVFQGKDAVVYASSFMDVLPSTTQHDSKTQNNTTSSLSNTYPQAGSDEVGTGDYFGPVCVCAAYVTSEHIQLLQSLGVRDSKKLTDKQILEIVPQILPIIPHSLLILDNEKYNEVHKLYNMNALKAVLHNQAYLNLAKKISLPKLKIVDQFTPEKNYYRYLSTQPNIIRGIHFETKAEDSYLSVACGSLISRYAFLKKMDEMNEQWNFTFPKGAGSKVDTAIQSFVDKHGYENLKCVAKVHFQNTSKIQLP